MGPLAGLPLGEEPPAESVPTGRLRHGHRVRFGLSDHPGRVPGASAASERVVYGPRSPVRYRPSPHEGVNRSRRRQSVAEREYLECTNPTSWTSLSEPGTVRVDAALAQLPNRWPMPYRLPPKAEAACAAPTPVLLGPLGSAGRASKGYRGSSAMIWRKTTRCRRPSTLLKQTNNRQSRRPRARIALAAEPPRAWVLPGTWPHGLWLRAAVVGRVPG